MKKIIILPLLLFLFQYCNNEIPIAKHSDVTIIVRTEDPTVKGIEGVITIKGVSDSINIDSLSIITFKDNFNRGDKVELSAHLKNPPSNAKLHYIIFEVYTNLPKPEYLYFDSDSISIEAAYEFL